MRFSGYVSSKGSCWHLSLKGSACIKQSLNEDNQTKTPEGEVMDELGLVRYCCRKIFLTHISLIDEI